MKLNIKMGLNNEKRVFWKKIYD